MIVVYVSCSYTFMARLKAAKRREQLLEVAVGLFAELGYDATTTSAIARAAGITEPVLYRHFHNKQEMFAAVVRNVAAIGIARWHKVLNQSADPVEQLRLICIGYTEGVQAMPQLYRVIQGALATSRDPSVRALIDEHFRQIQDILRRVTVDGQAKGVFRTDVSAEALVWRMFDLGVGFAVREGTIVTQRVHPADFADFILRGIAPDSLLSPLHPALSDRLPSRA